MTDEFRRPIESAVPGGLPAPVRAPETNFVAGAFAASVLFDVLSLIAQSPAQAHSDRGRAADLLTQGLSGALVSLALELIDDLLAPASGAAARTGKPVALNGAIIAVYLLDVAARRKPLDAAPDQSLVADVAPIGLSLLGLTLVGVAGKRN